MNLRRFFQATVLSAFVPLSSAIAADDGLYRDVFAPNSSFIRVLAPQQSFATIGATSLKDLNDGISSYVNVMPGDVEVGLSTASTVIPVEPNQHYTLIVPKDGAPVVLIDQIKANPAKADITLYNYSSQENVALYVPQAKATVLDDVALGAGKSIALKAPLTLDFEIRHADKVLATVSQVELSRKAGLAFVLLEKDGVFSAEAIANSYVK